MEINYDWLTDSDGGGGDNVFSPLHSWLSILFLAGRYKLVRPTVYQDSVPLWYILKVGLSYRTLHHIIYKEMQNVTEGTRNWYIVLVLTLMLTPSCVRTASEICFRSRALNVVHPDHTFAWSVPVVQRSAGMSVEYSGFIQYSGTDFMEDPPPRYLSHGAHAI